jgi:creatinine amidohydrolase
MLGMLSVQNTTVDWQRHTGDVVILPIGATEQHGPHLPLDTDIRGAGYFAQLLAEELDAALLPALPFSSSLEHAGFRGSVTLRPDTVMALVRDVATEMEKQAFHILVIMNGHGGNYCLGPVVREWNRGDRPLKILLVNWWEFADPALMEQMGMDIHAGERESSVMMAIAPGMVHVEKLPPTPVCACTDAIPLRQSDLNSFGFGHFSPMGPIGDGHLATLDKGHAVLAAVKKSMPDFVRDRIRRLREQPRYAGAGGILVRELTKEEMPAILALKAAEGWNQNAQDIEIFGRLGSPGIVAAVQNGHVLGTTALIRYENKIAWIGLVLVDARFRRMGVGFSLLQEALAQLEQVPCVKLDATPEGSKLYRRLGFVEESTLARWICAATPRELPESALAPRRAVAEDLEAMVELEAQTFGARRKELLQLILERCPQAWCLEEAGRVVAFCLGRPGANYYQVGPLVAADSRQAQALLAQVFRGLNGQPALIDVPDAQSELVSWLQERGFVLQRPLLRMRRGEAIPVTGAGQLFAICGPEFG